MVGRRGYHLMTLPWIATNEVQRGRIETYLEALRAGGHDAATKDVFVMYPAYVSDSDARAESEVVEHWHRWRRFALEALGLDPGKGEPYRKVFEHLEYGAMVRDARGVFGGPESCVAILRRVIKTVAPTHIGLVFHFGGLGQTQVLQSMERFARLVMPALGAGAPAS
jgi:alkanesulfonate monooxygenase SsuD/methylene tetrahydromethanopterin reductase-like flavin-dependent oxidoreductase (luciferase family)